MIGEYRAWKPTLHELRTVYSIDDLYSFHEMLDYEIELSKVSVDQ